MIAFKTFSVEGTVRAGFRLGRHLKKGDIVCLSGALGSGKTAFTGGIAAALGIKGYVTSPTFTIVNEYQGNLPLYHFDAYRISCPEEILETGFEEYLDGEGVVVVEWADIVKDMLPDEYIWVEIKSCPDGGNSIRTIIMEFRGDKYREYEDWLSDTLWVVGGI